MGSKSEDTGFQSSKCCQLMTILWINLSTVVRILRRSHLSEQELEGCKWPPPGVLITIIFMDHDGVLRPRSKFGLQMIKPSFKAWVGGLDTRIASTHATRLDPGICRCPDSQDLSWDGYLVPDPLWKKSGHLLLKKIWTPCSPSILNIKCSPNPF